MANAQEEAVGSGFGIGTQLGQYQDDFGLGLNVSSPSFADDRIAVRSRVNFMFHEHVQDRETTWTPYASFSLGVASVAGNVGEHIRLYGEGGVVGLLPSEEFSSDDFVFGGYGLFGFEFFMDQRTNYFVELGGVGTGAKADRITNRPIYSNGFLVSTGFRTHF